MMLIIRFVIFACLALGLPAAAEEAPLPPFEEWLAGVKTEAVGMGIRAETVDAAFTGITFDEGVVKSDRNQPEVKLEYPTYEAQRLTPARIKRGLDMMRAHQADLRAVAKAYGVQPRFIAAIWGLETNFGSYTGGKNIIQALVTLAYDPRRSDYFRKELLVALKILDEGDVTVADMKGSWAGAMGQPQFMPRSFEAYAQDFDGDGRRDIWNTPVDVFASIAFYLKSYGWRDDQTWGRPVSLPKGFAAKVAQTGLGAPSKSCALKNHLGDLTLAQWDDLGVRRLTGLPLPTVNLTASLVRPGGGKDQAFLTYGNYRAILRYNCSDFYALTVGQLADKLKEAE